MTATTLKAVEPMLSIMKRVNTAKPTAADRAEFARVLAENPAAWRAAGDVMEHTAQALIDDLGGDNSYFVRESLATGWARLAVDLARPGDGELERLLVQQVALCWLKLAYTEYQHRHVLTNGKATIAQGDFWERRLSAAQRRYVRAAEALARVRRLQLPAVQVNIAERQLNQINTATRG